MDGVSDVGESLAVDLLVPVQHLANGLVPLLDLGPGTDLGSEGRCSAVQYLNREWRIWNFSFDLK